MALASQQTEICDLQTFLAMLAEEPGQEIRGIVVPPEAQRQDINFDDVLAALKSPDCRTHPQNPIEANIDLEMIQDVILQNEEPQMDMMNNLAVDHESSQEFYSDLLQKCMSPIEENPSTIPLTTTDTSQLQDSQMSQTMSTDISEGISHMEPAIDATNDSGCSPVDEISEQTEGEECMETERAQADEPPALPDFEELLIRIRYRSQEVKREHIKNRDGCLVFFSKPWLFPPLANTKPDFVQFPDINCMRNAEMTDSQFKFTEQVLKALEKGLFLRCDQYGNVYATRFCRSKIFWYSTEKGVIAEAQGNHSVPNLIFQKLERNKEVMVFDNMLFQRKLLHYVVNKPTFKNEAAKANNHTIPISPAIFFTFAQSWNPLASALSSCLVSMVVNPVRARTQRQWGNEDRHESYDLSNYRLQMSSAEAGDKS